MVPFDQIKKDQKKHSEEEIIIEHKESMTPDGVRKKFERKIKKIRKPKTKPELSIKSMMMMEEVEQRVPDEIIEHHPIVDDDYIMIDELIEEIIEEETMPDGHKRITKKSRTIPKFSTEIQPLIDKSIEEITDDLQSEKPEQKSKIKIVRRKMESKLDHDDDDHRDQKRFEIIDKSPIIGLQQPGMFPVNHWKISNFIFHLI